MRLTVSGKQSSPFLLPQGPEYDEEAESDLTVTELRQRAQKQKAELERRMMGDGSDDEEEEKEEGQDDEGNKGHSKLSNEDSGCSWGMGELLVVGLCHNMLLLRCHPERVGVK